MLYDAKVESFIRVADSGSFSKAARQNFVTTAAVMNQINSLEEELNLTLFERTNRGVFLTAEGKTLYHDFKQIMHMSSIAIKSAKNLSMQKKQVLHIASFHMNKINFSPRYWELLLPLIPDIDIHVDTVDIQPGYGKPIFNNLGHGIDLLFGIFSQPISDKFNVNGLLLKEFPVCCAVPYDNPLAGKNCLTEDDLAGETLLLCAPGFFPQIDELEKHLASTQPEIKIKTFPRFNTDIFNRAIAERNLMITIDPWREIHPQLKTIPVTWPFTLSYGVMYGKEPNDTVLRFIEASESIRHLL